MPETDDYEWTKEELAWLRRAERLYADKPKSFKVYTIDGDLTACKLGVPYAALSYHIASNGVVPGCVMTDVHDDEDFGRR